MWSYRTLHQEIFPNSGIIANIKHLLKIEILFRNLKLQVSLYQKLLQKCFIISYLFFLNQKIANLQLFLIVHPFHAMCNEDPSFNELIFQLCQCHAPSFQRFLFSICFRLLSSFPTLKCLRDRKAIIKQKLQSTFSILTS